MNVDAQFAQSLKVEVISGLAASQQFSKLLDHCFGLSPGMRFLEDFPVWDPQWEIPLVIRMGVFQKGELVSCAGARMAQMRTGPSSEVPVALIGAVATSPQWRGLGFATRLMTELIQWARSRGAVRVLLWSSEHEFYKRLGFEPFGEEIRLPIQFVPLPSTYRLVKRLSPESLAEKVHLGWSPRIFDLRQASQVGLSLESCDRKWYQAHENVEWFYTGSSEKLSAYAAFGRGIDLNGVIHEWGGELNSLLEIFHTIRKMNKNSIVLGSAALMRKLGIPSSLGYREPLCLAKILTSNSIHSLPEPMWIWGLDAV